MGEVSGEPSLMVGGVGEGPPPSPNHRGSLLWHLKCPPSTLLLALPTLKSAL